jgi:hypothetical protein
MAELRTKGSYKNSFALFCFEAHYDAAGVEKKTPPDSTRVGFGFM